MLNTLLICRPDNFILTCFGFFRNPCKYPQTASEPFDQRQGRAARLSYQTGSTSLQISTPPRCSSLLHYFRRIYSLHSSQQLLKTLSPATYPHFDELKKGSEAAKRITDKINEAQRRAENEQTVKSLATRIDDWKGHHLENFGELLLDHVFTVTKSDIDREYHVFLFEKIILCCKEVLPGQQNGNKKPGKNSSLLKKQASTPTPLNGVAAAAASAPNQRKNTPLLLKGRIFLGNVTQAVPSPPRNSIGVSFFHLVWKTCV
jgi:hypothetical protein